MVEVLSVVGLGLVAVIAAYILISHQKRGRTYDATIVKGETGLINHTEGYCYVLGATPMSAEVNEYRLLRGDNFEVRRTYHNDELLDMNKMLTMVSRPLLITTQALANLAKKIDISRITQNYDELQIKFEKLQAYCNSLENTVDSRVEERISSAERLGRAYKPTRIKTS